MGAPSVIPSNYPSVSPTTPQPTDAPITSEPTVSPTTSLPTVSPTTSKPTVPPTSHPTDQPTTSHPTQSPETSVPTKTPSALPSVSPTLFKTTREVTLDGDYDTVVGNNKALFLQECSARLSVTCRDVRPGSVIILLAGLEEDLNTAEADIQQNGLD